jgi:DNA-binding NarL/FixJ family response regulator
LQKKIIIADDSEITHSIYKVYLAKHGDIEIIHCSNGQEAWDALSAQSGVILVLLDLEMPEMNGFQFLEKKKAQSAFSDIPVVVISWNDSNEDVQRAMQLGAAEFINKSELGELGEIINSTLKSSV